MPDDFYFFGTASLKAMASLYRGFYPNWSQKTFTKLTELFELDSTKRISSFSKGMQRQASIILAMSTRPKYLLLDEAFDGLDPVKRNLLRRILLEYITTDGISLIISSHNLRELEDLCDHVGVIRDKKVVFESGIDDMRANMNKYRVVFASDFNTDELKDFGLKGLIQDGKIITFIASGSTLELENKLKQFNPLLVESLPMTLEEIFLGETEAKDYDFGEIFGA
jgi:ABC-2 type transport system ATP-binding protein